METHTTPGAEIRPGTAAGSHLLKIPPGPAGTYRLAQLDDYTHLPRSRFPHRSPRSLRLRARVSAPDLPGTWGFGLWNDPFSVSLGVSGGTRRLPALPNAAWFFFASPHNYLSFRDDKPAQGFLAQTFRSPHLSAPLLALGAATFPMMLLPPLARRLRPAIRRVVQEDSFALDLDVTEWHMYTLEWRESSVTFRVDDQTLETGISPRPPLGIVIWIDNQYAALTPDGHLSFGSLANKQSSWLEISDWQGGAVR